VSLICRYIASLSPESPNELVFVSLASLLYQRTRVGTVGCFLVSSVACFSVLFSCPVTSFVVLDVLSFFRIWFPLCYDDSSFTESNTGDF
jgi:hypothetical protein